MVAKRVFDITKYPEFWNGEDVTYFFLFEFYRALMKVRPDIKKEIFAISKNLYHEYLQSSEWKIISDEVKAKFRHRCQICNRHKDTVQIDTHHRTYERLGKERLEDLTVLCTRCHSIFHANKVEYY